MEDEAIKGIVDQAIRAAIEAMKIEKDSFVDEAYTKTKQRLRALPIILDRLEENRARLAMMEKENALQGKSKSIIRFTAHGQRVDPLEALEAVKQDLAAHIAADEFEVEQIENALHFFQGDPYYCTVYDHYFNGATDDDLAERLFCDASTIRRHRGTLIHKIAIRLYGAFAI